MMQYILNLVEKFDRLKFWPWKQIGSIVGVTFFLSTIITIAVSWLILPLTSSKFKDKTSDSLSLIKAENPTLSKDRLSQIIKRNIFNIEGIFGEDEDSDSKDEKKVFEKDVAVKSDLPFTLVGTIYAGDPYSGIAIIKDNQQGQFNSFFVGDPLNARAKITEIQREKVIFKVDDHLEYLELEQKDIVRAKKRGIKTNTATDEPRYATEAPPETYKEEGFERNGNSIVLSSDFRRKILTTDFAKVLQDAKAVPHLVGGELAGFKLTRIREDSIYQKAGIQNGDIIKEINGVSLVDTAQAIKLLHSLKGENEIEIRVDRGGTNVNLTMQVK